MKNLFKNKYWLFIIVCISLVLICSKSSYNTTLDEVKLKNEIEVNKRQFAMYTRDSEDSEYTEYTGEDLFPKGYKLNETESKCMDNNGEDVTTEEVMSQTEDGKIMVTSTKTVYCTFYFDKEPTAGDVLKKKVGQNGLIQATYDTDLTYRYVGACNVTNGSNNNGCDGKVNNFICFGSKNCGINDDYMYRIIGIDNKGRLKLIKNGAIGTNEKWNDDTTKYVTWGAGSPSKLYINLNGSEFLDNESYVPLNSNKINWKDKIDETKWNIGDVTNLTNQINGSYGMGIYDQEDNTKSSLSRIGLMYLSDYYFAYNGSGNNYCNSPDYINCKSSWLHISNNGVSNTNSSDEWTMTRYGFDGNNYLAWQALASGTNNTQVLFAGVTVRPAFYLKDDVTISGGRGTLSDPYIIN